MSIPEFGRVLTDSAPVEFGRALDGEKTGDVEKTDRPMESLMRKSYQGIGGMLDVTPIGMTTSLGSALVTAEGLQAVDELDEHEIAVLKSQFPNAPWENFKPINKEKLKQEVRESSELLPNLSNLERFVEEKTGLQLQPKTRLEKAIRFLSSVMKVKPGSASQKVKGGAIGTATKEGLVEAGVPEPIADITGFIAGAGAPTPFLKKDVKPSGMPKRRYEDVSKPTKVSKGTSQSIREKVEGDVRKVVGDLVQKESKTSRAMKDDPSFFDKLEEGLEKVEKLAADIPDTISTAEIKRQLRYKRKSRIIEGISPDEFERYYSKEMNKLYKEITIDKKASMTDLIKQYRKNNKGNR